MMIRLDGSAHRLERVMIYRAFDGILAGDSETDLIEFVQLYHAGSPHIRSEVWHRVTYHIRMHFAKKNPRTSGSR
ncbi:MAG: hypothetical protein ACI4JQ_02045 [Ruminococcus sp.]